MGGALGLAVLATLSASRTSSLTHAHHAVATALLSGYRLAFTVGAGLVVLGLVASLTVLREPAHAASEEEVAVALELTAEPV